MGGGGTRGGVAGGMGVLDGGGAGVLEGGGGLVGAGTVSLGAGVTLGWLVAVAVAGGGTGVFPASWVGEAVAVGLALGKGVRPGPLVRVALARGVGVAVVAVGLLVGAWVPGPGVTVGTGVPSWATTVSTRPGSSVPMTSPMMPTSMAADLVLRGSAL